MQKTCDSSTGAHGTPDKNQTCDDSCYHYCWGISAKGDCSDMDDAQGFCVGECMAYCIDRDCRDDKPVKWSSCQQRCAKENMVSDHPDFMNYSLCMAKCTDVPTSPWGANAALNVTSSILDPQQPYCCAGVNDCEPYEGSAGGTCPDGQAPEPEDQCVSSCMK